MRSDIYALDNWASSTGHEVRVGYVCIIRLGTDKNRQLMPLGISMLYYPDCIAWRICDRIEPRMASW